MKLPLTITIAVIIILLVLYFILSGSLPGMKKYDWNLELTKPQEYEVEVMNVTYRTGNKEIYRLTSMPPYTDWVGSAGGRVLHGDAKAALPDSIKISWKEVKTGAVYNGALAFPGRKVIAHWNDNYKLQQRKWGADYPQGPLSLKLGIAPGGVMSLWFADLDVNTSGFALELATSRAEQAGPTGERSTLDPSFNLRFGTPQFHAFTGANVVSVRVVYHNGEAEVFSLKNENGSTLKQINDERGYGLARNIRVSWFDAAGQGYYSFYKVSSKNLPKDEDLAKLRNTPLIYLLDRQDAPSAPWNHLTNKLIITLEEVARKPFG